MKTQEEGSVLWTQDLKDLLLRPSGTREGVCWGDVFEYFSVHTDLFLASEKQDVQSGLYQPGRGRRSPCPQEIRKFLAADAPFNFNAQRKKAIWLSKDLPARTPVFLRVRLRLQARAAKCCMLASDDGTRSVHRKTSAKHRGRAAKGSLTGGQGNHTSLPEVFPVLSDLKIAGFHSCAAKNRALCWCSSDQMGNACEVFHWKTPGF